MQVGFEVIKFIVGQVCPTDPPNTLIERIRHKKLLKRTYSLIHPFTYSLSIPPPRNQRFRPSLKGRVSPTTPNKRSSHRFN